MSSTVIEADSLTKSFGDAYGIQEISFSIDEGDVFGFVGPNGAGKSTTINLMLGYQRPTSGSISVFGNQVIKKPRKTRKRIGVVPEDVSLYGNRTGVEHIEMVARLKQTDVDPSEMSEQVELSYDDLQRPVSGYSTGMEKRLLLALALIGDPDLLVLDEPGSGLDPNGIRRLQNIIRDVSDDGKTVFFSSHILSNIESVCDHIGVINMGRMEYTGTLTKLREEYGNRKKIVTKFDGGTPVEAELTGLDNVIETRNAYDNGELHITYKQDQNIERILEQLIKCDNPIESIETEQKSLSELFGQITGDDK